MFFIRHFHLKRFNIECLNIMLLVYISEISVDDVRTEVRYDHLSAPNFWKGYNLSHFGLFVLGSTYFLQSFGVMGQNRKYQLLY